MSGKWPLSDPLSLLSMLFCQTHLTTFASTMFTTGLVYLVEWEPWAGSVGRKSRDSHAL